MPSVSRQRDDPAGAGVVGDRQVDQIVADRRPLQEVLEIGLAEQDAGLGLEQGVALRVIEVGAGRDVPGRGRHHLHQAAGAGVAFGASDRTRTRRA